MFQTVLIANRGEIACRLARTLKRMRIRSVAVYSEADRNSPHVCAADVALPLGGQSAADSYLRADLILDAARRSGAQAIIPGYGFLSENAAFAAQCEAEGIVFVGPTPQQMAQFGLKHAARDLAKAAGLPLTPGSGLLPDAAAARSAAREIGYPVMLKSTAGGGGIGLIRCTDDDELSVAFASVRRQGEAFFANDGVFVERFVDHARHIEVQIFGDGQGHVIALGERDCSVQRRNQKLIEETPAPHLPAAVRKRMLLAATALGRSVHYRSAGTVEFIYDPARACFHFLEVNTRLQVEHGITESVTGIDLVEWMIRNAAGEDLAALIAQAPHTVSGASVAQDDAIAGKGASIEVRLYAENPLRQFAPSPGTLTEVVFPDDGVRVDSGIARGCEVSPFYDPLLAKLIVHAEDRTTAIANMIAALDATRLSGIATNLDYLRQLLRNESFQAGDVSTRFLDDFRYRPAAIDVIEPGTFTSVQDYPGRTGYWDIGVPPSGPMDDWAFRVGNRIVGNSSAAAGIEATMLGPTLRFHCDAVIALTGAPTDGDLDGCALTFWAPMAVKAGQVLRVGKISSGCRVYLSVRGGIDVPIYLGSRSTFVLAGFGGHAGRVLRVADVLMVADPASRTDATQPPDAASTLPTLPTPSTPSTPRLRAPSPVPVEHIPVYRETWRIGVLHGPHGAPDFFTQASVDAFFAVDWQVHYQSSRLGIRLSGPKPQWARADGGEAGLHPSNIHDCEYAIGSINFTGDMPVILTRDGPSLGGFVCPVTIAKAELWKVGQVKPGDLIRFFPMSFDEALALEHAQDALLEDWDALTAAASSASGASSLATLPMQRSTTYQPTGAPAVLYYADHTEDRPKTVVRQAGDHYLLLEYGEDTLDLNDRFRVHALMEALNQRAVAGVCELAPGVRSLQIRYDSRIVHQQALVDAIVAIDATLQHVSTMRVKSRVLHLPLAYEDSATLEAIARYQQSVRSDAPWLPSNTEFIRRINGLPTGEAVRDTIFATRYLVLGMGDVYLGAPCAVPIDPRSRLLTSKYNPARTHTSEGAVGIGGVYMCIYGMDSPGGYQLVGRTLPIWNTFLKHRQFTDEKPWLLRFFDQIQFYPVDEATLETLRNDFREGRHAIHIDETIFDLGAYNAFIDRIQPELQVFRATQQAAFDAEVAHWATMNDPFESTSPPPFERHHQTPTDEHHDQHGKSHIDIDIEAETDATATATAHTIISAEITGNVWKLLAPAGTRVQAGDTLIVLEAMKMEFAVIAPHDGIVNGLHCQVGKTIHAGDPLMSLAITSPDGAPSGAGSVMSAAFVPEPFVPDNR